MIKPEKTQRAPISFLSRRCACTIFVLLEPIIKVANVEFVPECSLNSTQGIEHHPCSFADLRLNLVVKIS